MTLLLTEVATDWSAIWSITLVSFGLVLVILFLLIYVMKIFGLFFRDKAKTSAAPVAKVTAATESDDEIAAAIATAIALAQGALHIEESGILTFSSDRGTAWNNKAYGITQMPEHIH